MSTGARGRRDMRDRLVTLQHARFQNADLGVAREETGYAAAPRTRPQMSLRTVEP